MVSIYDTVPRPPRPKRLPHTPRQVSRFERWAWSPITAFRIGLTLGYIGAVYFGISAFIAGVPAFVITAPYGWTPVWAALLVLGGVVAVFGSLSDSRRFRNVELAGAWALFLTLGVYSAVLLALAYGTADANRAAVGAGFVALGIQPGVRMLWLMSQLGRK
jgi:hypothetical protein